MSNSKVAPVFLVASQQSENQTNNADNIDNDNSNSNIDNMESLRAENTQLKQEMDALKKENQALKKEVAELSKKRKAPETAASGGAATMPPASKKAKTPAQRKKLFTKWSKALERLSAKEKITNAWGGDTYKTTIKETTPWSQADFDSVFGGYEATGGVKIQPRPDFKPTSQITLLHWKSGEQVQSLFGKDDNGNQIVSQTGYQVQTWRSRNFCKSYKTGMASADLKGLQVEYNKSKQTLKLLFDMEMAGFSY